MCKEEQWEDDNTREEDPLAAPPKANTERKLHWIFAQLFMAGLVVGGGAVALGLVFGVGLEKKGDKPDKNTNNVTSPPQPSMPLPPRDDVNVSTTSTLAQSVGCNENFSTQVYSYSMSFERSDQSTGNTVAAASTTQQEYADAFRKAYQSLTNTSEDACAPVLQSVAAVKQQLQLMQPKFVIVFVCTAQETASRVQPSTSIPFSKLLQRF